VVLELASHARPLLLEVVIAPDSGLQR